MIPEIFSKDSLIIQTFRELYASGLIFVAYITLNCSCCFFPEDHHNAKVADCLDRCNEIDNCVRVYFDFSRPQCWLKRGLCSSPDGATGYTYEHLHAHGRDFGQPIAII